MQEPFKNRAEIAVVIINHHLVRAQDRIGGGGIVNRDRTSLSAPPFLCRCPVPLERL